MKNYRRVQVDGGGSTVDKNYDNEDGGRMRLKPSGNNANENQEPFTGINVRRKASFHRDIKRDYLDIPKHPYLMKVLQKRGDSHVFFADKVMKFTGSGKMKRHILLITNIAIYIVDPETDALKRRIVLAAVEKISLSELSDNFFAIIIPTEYDILMASKRKTEIVTVLFEAIKNASNYELELVFSNSFEYNATAELVKEVQFEEVEGEQKLQSSWKSSYLGLIRGL